MMNGSRRSQLEDGTPSETRPAAAPEQVSRRVYHLGEAPLVMEGRTPLYLNWVVSGGHEELYLVPAEIGGWAKRQRYRGPSDRLVEMAPQRAEAILRFICAPPGAVEEREEIELVGRPAGRDVSPGTGESGE